MTTLDTDPFVKHLMRANQLIVDRKLPDAAKALNQLQDQNPADPRVYMLGMRLAEAAGNPTAALKSAQRAVELSPQWHVSVLELGALFSRQQRHAEALAQARKGVLLAPPENREALARAADIAASARDHQSAVEWILEAVDRAGGNSLVSPEMLELRYRLATALRHLSRHDEAMAIFSELLELVPDSPGALVGAIECARALGDKPAERIHAAHLLSLDPERAEYKYAHAIAHGQTPKTQPEATVSELFDNYADRFDFHLVRGLQYRIPEIVANRLVELYPDRRFNLLDLGCGTGLLGIFLGPVDGFLVGVDLSEKMLAKAARTGLYARLHNVNILDALRDTPSEEYEVIACNDVFIYVGDLSEAIPQAWRILKPGGHFIFSCETAEEDEPDLVLRPHSNRYAHKASAVVAACKGAGFSEVELQHVEKLRMEHQQALPGFLVFARKDD